MPAFGLIAAGYGRNANKVLGAFITAREDAVWKFDQSGETTGFSRLQIAERPRVAASRRAVLKEQREKLKQGKPQEV